MAYLTYGDVHTRAIRAGLVMSRDRRSNQINLRRRDTTVSDEEWRQLTLEEALAIVRGAE